MIRPDLKFICFVIVPILMASLGELLLKYSLNHMTVSLSPFGVVQMLGNPMVVFAVSLVICGGFLWLVAMSKYELSFIYPFLSLNYVVILVGSHALLGEFVSPQRVMAIGLIMVGLYFISRSPNAENTHD